MPRVSRNTNCSLFPYERTDVISLQEAKQQMGWNITAFDLPKAWTETMGEGVKVAVIDSGCDLDHPDLAPNLEAGRNILNPTAPPQDDCGHGCVAPGTLVHTNYCGIEDIEVLYDRVPMPCIFDPSSGSWIKDVRSLGIKTYSADKETGISQVSEIEFMHKTPINGEVLSVELEGGVSLKLTKWHPVYLSETTPGGRVRIVRKRADELIVGEKFFRPNGPECGSLINDMQRIYGGNYFECSICNHIANHLRLSSKDSTCKKCRTKGGWTSRRKAYFLNEDLAYVVGIVLTDGYVASGKRCRVEVSSCTPEILQRTQDCLSRIGFVSRIEAPNGRSQRLLCSSKELVDVLVGVGIMAQRKTYQQRLPEWIGKSPKNVILSFLAGVIDGDGCIDKSNSKNRITTASRQFADELRCLMNSLGIGASVAVYKNDLLNRSRGRKINPEVPEIYNVTFSSIGDEIAKLMAHPEKTRRIKGRHSRFDKISRSIKNINISKTNEYFYDFTVKDNNNYVANGVMVSNTHVCGIIAACNNEIGMIGVAPKAHVIPIKVLDKNGNGNLKDVTAGVYAAIDLGADIITMSLGCPCPLPELHKAIQAAANKGIPCFVAAGNAGLTKDVFYPGAYEETIAIGSIDSTFSRSNFSNTGLNLDFMAPGQDILSTVPDNWYAIMSGTSMAGPWVAGLAALLLAACRKYHGPDCPHLKTVEGYRNKFRLHTYPITGDNAGKEFFQGFGIIDVKGLDLSK